MQRLVAEAEPFRGAGLVAVGAAQGIEDRLALHGFLHQTHPLGQRQVPVGHAGGHAHGFGRQPHGQVAWLDSVGGEHHGTAHHVVQLGHIARPGVGDQHFGGFGRKARQLPPQFAARGFEDDVDEVEDIVGARSERRHREDRVGEEEVQVAAEEPAGHELAQLRRGAREEPHVEWKRCRAAHPAHAALLEVREQTVLCRQGQTFHVAQEQGAAVGQFHLAVGEDAARVGSVVVSEELQVSNGRDEAGAVDSDEGASCAGGTRVDPPCEDLLSRAVLAEEESGTGGGGQLGGVVAQAGDGAARPEKFGERRHAAEPLAERPHLARKPAVLGGTGDAGQGFGVAERLGQIVVGTQVHGPHRRVHVVQARDHDDGEVGVEAMQLLEHLEAAHVGQADVQEHHIGRVLVGQAQSARAIRSFGGLVARVAEQHAEEVAHALHVVDYQHMVGTFGVVRHGAPFAVRAGLDPNMHVQTTCPWPSHAEGSGHALQPPALVALMGTRRMAAPTRRARRMPKHGTLLPSAVHRLPIALAPPHSACTMHGIDPSPPPAQGAIRCLLRSASPTVASRPPPRRIRRWPCARAWPPVPMAASSTSA